ncbi:MAG: LTXXQ motif family protein [Pseudomonadota bacterium]
MKQTFGIAALALTLVFAAAPTVSAQQFDQAQMQETIARLNLTEAQKQAARPVIEAGIHERLQILKDAGFERGKKPTLSQLMKVRGPIGESRARTEAQLSAILDPVQMAEYKKITDERRQQLRAQFQ